MSALAGLQVLVTRPEPQAGRWAQQLQALGAVPLVAPMMTLEAVSEPEAREAIKACIMDFDLYQKAIFVSQNAVAHAFDWLDHYWPQLPMGVEYYGVGERTARALAEEEVEVTAWQSRGAMNSEALLEAPELQNVAEQRIVIFRGVGGRGLLGQALRERGARVDYCELYERRCPEDAVERLRRALAPRPTTRLIVALHSAETLDNYHQTRGQLAEESDALAQAPLLVPGERVAQRARTLGYHRVLVAENATDPSMLEALEAASQDPILFQTDGTRYRD
ncbi:uroporphyrinogen-III synthase [Marinimicrobium locisalis]|uniref:uroporphyrinogen-III synthase n=1 Tax=Marinimicrobium locisalis TaxID=546022 RepID=UPI0032217DB0